MAFTPPTLASETIAHIGSFPIRNSLVMGWIAIIVWIVIAVIFKKKGGRIVPKGIQNAVEFIVEGLFNFFDSVTQNRVQTRRFFPIVATIFLFVITSNWMGILPGVGSIGFYEKHIEHPESAIIDETETEAYDRSGPAAESGDAGAAELDSQVEPPVGAGPESQDVEKNGLVFVPYFRSAYADVNMTLALAIVSIFMTQLFGIWSLGFFSYAGKFLVNPLRDPIGSFVGILELFAELAKVISFTFRLFGNIFAGEMLLTVISFLAPYLAPIPFYGLEIFVGFIQALVFSLLTLVFMKMAVTSHHEETAHA